MALWNYLISAATSESSSPLGERRSLPSRPAFPPVAIAESRIAPLRGGRAGWNERGVLLPARRGNLAGVSEEVLEALSRRSALGRGGAGTPLRPRSSVRLKADPRKRAQPESVRQSLQTTLDAITTAPAVIDDGRGDMVAGNAMAHALFSEMFVQLARRPVNNARFVFLDPRATIFYRDWPKVADETVAALRTQAGQDPYDKALSDLVGELSTQSEELPDTLGRSQRAPALRRVPNVSDTPAVGDIDLTYEVFDVSAENGLRLIVYTTQPGSTSEDALKLLASWAATHDDVGQGPSVRQ